MPTLFGDDGGSSAQVRTRYVHDTRMWSNCVLAFWFGGGSVSRPTSLRWDLHPAKKVRPSPSIRPRAAILVIVTTCYCCYAQIHTSFGEYRQSLQDYNLTILSFSFLKKFSFSDTHGFAKKNRCARKVPV